MVKAIVGLASCLLLGFMVADEGIAGLLRTPLGFASEFKPSGYQWHELLAPANVPNWVLAAIAGLAAWMAYKTLRAIKQQVDTFVSKERARITVDIKPLEPSGKPGDHMVYDKSPMLPPKDQIWRVDLRIANSGETSAFIGSALYNVCIRPRSWDARTESIDLSFDLPKVMRAGKESIENRETSIQIDRATAIAIMDGSLGVFVIGHVEFGDVFDNHWSMRFCRRWGGTFSRGDWQYTSTWHDYEPQTRGEFPMNGELRIERPSKLRRVLRRMLKKDPQAPIVEIT
jgi:hypothetical protein